MRIYFLLFAAIISGCASTSGVVSMGGDVFMVSRLDKGVDSTGSQVKAAAVKEANEFCSSSGKVIEIVKATQKDMVPFTSNAQAEVEFKCIPGK